MDRRALLKESPVEQNKITASLDKIENKAILIDSIIAGLMDTVAIETGRLSLSRELLSLPELLKIICEAGTTQLNMNGNQVTYDIQQNLPKIWADPARIEQVMTNLLSNAVQHTKDGKIDIKLARAGKYQMVSVADNGEGMGGEIARGALTQYNFSTKRDYWRHGIGLFVCRQIIQSHGGDVWIDSEKGRGTCVSFTLME